MHRSSQQAMEQMLYGWDGPARVLDVGSRDVNGSYRETVESRGWTYTGLDIEPGQNVDVVGEPYRYPFEDGAFDVVISGQTLEHVERPWEWVPELVRVLRPGGLLCIVVPWSAEPHNHPEDCWRVLPDGMRALFDHAGGLERYEIGRNSIDTWGRAWRAA